MSFLVLQAIAGWVVLSTCALVIGFVFAAPLMARPLSKRGMAAPAVLVLFFLLNFGVSLDYALPAAFGGARFAPPGALGILITFLAPTAFVGTWLLVPGSYLREFAGRMPLAWLTWPQVFRSIGGLFLAYHAFGRVPGGFAWPAGVGDLIVGCTALPMLSYIQRQPSATRLPFLWNCLGVLDFTIAVSVGFALNAVGDYPLVIIPAFLVPVALLLHILSFYKLSLMRRTYTTQLLSNLPLLPASGITTSGTGSVAYSRLKPEK